MTGSTLFLLLLVLACPLMMMLMMRGGHGRVGGEAGKADEASGDRSIEELPRRREELDRQIAAREEHDETPTGGRAVGSAEVKPFFEPGTLWGYLGRRVAMNETTYRVPGMSCAHCEHAVSSELRAVPGVASVDVDLETKLVVVRGEQLEDEALRAAIEEAGYEAA